MKNTLLLLLTLYTISGTAQENVKSEILISLMKSYGYFNLVSTKNLSDISYMSDNIADIQRLNSKVKIKIKNNYNLFSKNEYNQIMDHINAYEEIKNIAELNAMLIDRNSKANVDTFTHMDNVFKKSLMNILKDYLKSGVDVAYFLPIIRVIIISEKHTSFVTSSITTYRKSILESLVLINEKYNNPKFVDYYKEIDIKYIDQNNDSKTEQELEKIREYYKQGVKKDLNNTILNMFTL